MSVYRVDQFYSAQLGKDVGKIQSYIDGICQRLCNIEGIRQRLSYIGGTGQRLCCIGGTWQRLCCISGTWQSLCCIVETGQRLYCIGGICQRLCCIGELAKDCATQMELVKKIVLHRRNLSKLSYGKWNYRKLDYIVTGQSHVLCKWKEVSCYIFLFLLSPVLSLVSSNGKYVLFQKTFFLSTTCRVSICTFGSTKMRLEWEYHPLSSA